MKSTSRLTLLALSLLVTAFAPLTAKEPSPQADRPAQPISTVAPVLPDLARRADTAAEVTVAFTVTAKGTVIDAEVVDHNNPDLIPATLAAIRQWTFRPAIKNGQAVAAQLEQTFTFSVRDPAEVERAAQLASKKRTRK